MINAGNIRVARTTRFARIREALLTLGEGCSFGSPRATQGYEPIAYIESMICRPLAEAERWLETMVFGEPFASDFP
jgi:hypothetical protein